MYLLLCCHSFNKLKDVKTCFRRETQRPAYVGEKLFVRPKLPKNLELNCKENKSERHLKLSYAGNENRFMSVGERNKDR